MVLPGRAVAQLGRSSRSSAHRPARPSQQRAGHLHRRSGASTTSDKSLVIATRPCGGLAERPRAARRQGDLRPQHRHRAATGHVTLIEPDGQVLFADYAELTSGHERRRADGDARASCSRTASWRPTARGAPAGEINEMSQVVYSTCNLCKKHPDTAAIVADPCLVSASQDAASTSGSSISDAEMRDVRHPGRLFPVFLDRRPVGEAGERAAGAVDSASARISAAFFAQPYYWVIDDQSDATFTPMMTTRRRSAARRRVPAAVQLRLLRR